MRHGALDPSLASVRVVGAPVAGAWDEPLDRLAVTSPKASRQSRNSRLGRSGRLTSNDLVNTVRGVRDGAEACPTPLDHLKTVLSGGTRSSQLDGCLRRRVASGGRLVMNGTWDVKRKDVGAVAVYGGRKGVINVVTAVSERATAKQCGAIGAQVLPASLSEKVLAALIDQRFAHLRGLSVRSQATEDSGADVTSSGLNRHAQ